MTKQEIFNVVWTHFVTNKSPASIEHGFCMYRGPDGVKCAVGCLIPDELYSPGFEKYNIRSLVQTSHILSTKLPWLVTEIDFIQELQTAHDRSASVQYFQPDLPFFEKIQIKLNMIRSKYSLTLPHLPTE